MLRLLFLSLLVNAGSAHEHGAALFNLALEKNSLSIEFEIPAHDLVGFEKPPKTPTQILKSELAKKTLRDPARLLEIPEAAECKLKEAKAEGIVLGSADSGKGHSDVDVSFEFYCAKPEALELVELKIFDVYKDIGKIKFQTMVDGQQGAGVLNTNGRKLKLKP